MTVFNSIRAALETEIANITGIPSSANRAWENRVFNPTTGTPYVRMTLVPTESRPAVRGPNPQKRYQGLFMVDCFYPLESNLAVVDALADNICAAYTVDDVLTSGSINVRFDYAERGQAVIDHPWYMVPVSIAWYTYN